MVKPSPSDGERVWRLIKETGSLDLNSVYSYIMLCDIFRDTCVIAAQAGEAVGFISAYRRPDRPQTLFVWQVAVAGSMQGQGLGKRMLRELLARRENADIRFVEATIGPDNTASRRLFLGLAEEKGCESSLTECYPARFFPEASAHEPELLLSIGPIMNNK
ncbi:diaminobutyrate acetyltransferase [Paenibacillus sp. sptzw28]|uniref:diaminobutyrate acetyltransferase n=1 Tax=Paenibacillus sp. sptzw28 TaxID=715179 RepID=UPI0021632DDE|nr:diaminobutyrate acetyltransferase [Paenibacillus sp. sptzw28]